MVLTDFKGCKIDREITCMVLLGLSLLLVFSSFHTVLNLEKILLASIHDDNPDYNGDLSIVRGMFCVSFAVCMLFVPSVISISGPRGTLAIGALGYTAFVASHVAELTWVLYVGSALVGAGTSLVWTALSNYVILNSTPFTVTRNVAIFAAISQQSIIYGNLFVNTIFVQTHYIDNETRSVVVAILLTMSVAGIIMMALLPPPLQRDGKTKTNNLGGPIMAVIKTFSLASTKGILILSVFFVFVGLEESFINWIYNACVGHTLQMENSMKLSPLIGSFVGIAETASYIFLITFSLKISTHTQCRNGVLILAVALDLLAFLLIFLNMPDNSTFGPTDEQPLLINSEIVAIACAVLMGVSDGILLVLIVSLLLIIYPENSVESMTLFMFGKSLASAISFYYSAYIGLYIQLVILSLFGALGASAFCLVSSSTDDSAEEDVPEFQQTRL